MSLTSRIENFDNIHKRFKANRPSPLFLEVKIDQSLYEKLKLAAAIYMSKCLGPNKIHVDERDIINAFVNNRNQIANITPNGLIVPKRHLIIEFNYLVQAFNEVINSLNINDFISSWHIPLNLRFKDGEMVKENIGRKFATENIHSDSWAGESAESVTVMIPIFGDLERNHMTFFEPPTNFEEEWLGPKTSYSEGEEIAKAYKKIDLQQKLGHLYLSDFATLHSSTRLPNAGPRVSIDTTFTLKRVHNEIEKEVIHPWRENERISPTDFSSIGSECLLVFPNRNGENVDSSQGFKHPTDLSLVRLFEKLKT